MKHQSPRGMTWTLLEIQTADRESVRLSTGVALKRSEGAQKPAGRARVSVGAWIAAAVAEAWRQGATPEEGWEGCGGAEALIA